MEPGGAGLRSATTDKFTWAVVPDGSQPPALSRLIGSELQKGWPSWRHFRIFDNKKTTELEANQARWFNNFG
jgi:hypothetical protein